VKSLLIVYLLIVGLTFLGCTSTNQVTSLNKLSNEEIEAYNSDPNHTNKIVCKNEESIGTRIPIRVCRMKSSIDERTRQDQRSIEEIQAGATHTTLKGE